VACTPLGQATLLIETLELMEEFEAEPSTNYGRALQNVGMATMIQGDPLEAIAWFERASVVFADKGDEAAFDRARTDTALTRAAERAGQFHRALDYGRRASEGLDASGADADDPIRRYLQGLLRQVCENPTFQPPPARCDRILAVP